MDQKKTGKDLTKEAPHSPRTRIGGYVILGRTADKCRALLWGNIGEYHFDCPLDNMLFGFKGVKGDAFKAQVESGASDEDLAHWLQMHGAPKTPEEVKAWADGMDQKMPVNNPDMHDFFVGECQKLGLDPQKTSLFDWLEADDKASHAKN